MVWKDARSALVMIDAVEARTVKSEAGNWESEWGLPTPSFGRV